MVYIYLPAIYYHLNGCHKREFVGGGVFRCSSGLSCFESLSLEIFNAKSFSLATRDIITPIQK